MKAEAEKKRLEEVARLAALKEEARLAALKEEARITALKEEARVAALKEEERKEIERKSLLEKQKREEEEELERKKQAKRDKDKEEEERKKHEAQQRQLEAAASEQAAFQTAAQEEQKKKAEELTNQHKLKEDQEKQEKEEERERATKSTEKISIAPEVLAVGVEKQSNHGEAIQPERKSQENSDSIESTQLKTDPEQIEQPAYKNDKFEPVQKIVQQTEVLPTIEKLEQTIQQEVRKPSPRQSQVDKPIQQSVPQQSNIVNEQPAQSTDNQNTVIEQKSGEQVSQKENPAVSQKENPAVQSSEKRAEKDSFYEDFDYQESHQRHGRALTVAYEIMESSKLDETLLSKYIAPENKLQTPYPLIEDLSDSNEKLAMFERLDSGFLKAVRESGILDFCEKYLRKVRGIFSDLDVGELMQYGEQPVNDLFLTYLVSSHKTIFANMLEYIYLKEDKVASLATSGPRYIAMLLSMVHQNPAFMDEVYLQVIKQLIDCPLEILIYYYATCLLMLCSSYTVSQRWLYGVLNFLYIFSFQPDTDPQTLIRNKLPVPIINANIRQLFKTAFFRLIKQHSCPHRKYPPTQQEIILTRALKYITIFIYNHRRVPIEIHIYQGNTLFVEIESYYTPDDLVDAVCSKLQIMPQKEKMTIALCSPSESLETIVASNMLVIDVLRHIEIKKTQLRKDLINFSLPHLALKIKDFFIFDPSDLNSIDLYFLHFASEYRNSRFKLKTQQIIKLASLKLFVEYASTSPLYFKTESFIFLYIIIRLSPN